MIRHERIETTVPKAKELRPFVERLITIAKRGLAEGPKTTKALHAKRLVAVDVHKPETVDKLFETIAPRFAARPGGYTRILKLGFRRGDAADMAQIELVGSEYNPNLEKEVDGRGQGPREEDRGQPAQEPRGQVPRQEGRRRRAGEEGQGAHQGRRRRAQEGQHASQVRRQRS